MGWSCRADAGRTLDAWRALCVESTGSSNTWETRRGFYFYDIGREHDDGAITGTVFRMISGGMARGAGSFRINGDGTVARGPALLKEAYRRRDELRTKSGWTARVSAGAGIGSGGPC